VPEPTGRRAEKRRADANQLASGPLTDAGQVLLSALEDFLVDDGWPVADEDHGERAFAVPVEGESGRWICVAQVPPERDLVLFTSILPIFVPPDGRVRVAEFLTRANFGMLSGAFELDMDEGELRYRTSLDFTGADAAQLAASALLRPLIRQMVYGNVVNVDRYFPGVMSVLYAGLSPTEAVARVEAE